MPSFLTGANFERHAALARQPARRHQDVSPREARAPEPGWPERELSIRAAGTGVRTLTAEEAALTAGAVFHG
jgi:hypothetical protein